MMLWPDCTALRTTVGAEVAVQALSPFVASFELVEWPHRSISPFRVVETFFESSNTSDS